MATANEKQPGTELQRQATRENLPAIGAPRLPYHPLVEERFGIDKASWKALVEAVFPNATSTESVILALSYCRARKLDPFKRNVHIVPIWNKDAGCLVDTIWPGIGELRTTAFRTGEYAGRGETVFGPDITQKIGSIEITYPEWAQVTVCRMVAGQKVEFVGPRVYWVETYAQYKRNDPTPNDMWKGRPRGQLEKCAEAAALRAAFPEEIGSDYTNDEVQTYSRGSVIESGQPAPNSLDQLADRLIGHQQSEPPDNEEPEPITDAHGEVIEQGDSDDVQQDTEPEQSELDPMEAEIQSLAQLAAAHGCPKDEAERYARQALDQEQPAEWLDQKPWAKGKGKTKQQSIV